MEAGDLSYRFTGDNTLVVNNYVCLDNNKIGVCDNAKLYRILGLYKNEEEKYEIKVIKLESIGSYTWISIANEGKNNLWSLSELNKKILNEDFLNSLDKDLINYITLHTWITGGVMYDNIMKNNAFNVFVNEIKSPNFGNYGTSEDLRYQAKIGLMYVSDFGYSAIPALWNNQLNSYNSKYGWIYQNNDEWTITRNSYDQYNAYFVVSEGKIGSNNVNNTINEVRPVFYLISGIKSISGSGLINDPYRIT